MAMHSTRAFALDHSSKRRPRRPPRPVGQRLVSALRSGGTRSQLAVPGKNRVEAFGGGSLQRFPVVRRGYDPAAVEAYVAELEAELAAVDRELVELRGSGAAAQEVASEIKRIGEQTSAVLMAAHDQREAILRGAREEAERCVAQATATASALTAECEARLHELEHQTELAHGERNRLLAELRTISGALAAVADAVDQQPEP
jgi:DivIVA domain-containing protein